MINNKIIIGIVAIIVVALLAVAVVPLQWSVPTDLFTQMDHTEEIDITGTDITSGGTIAQSFNCHSIYDPAWRLQMILVYLDVKPDTGQTVTIYGGLSDTIDANPARWVAYDVVSYTEDFVGWQSFDVNNIDVGGNNYIMVSNIIEFSSDLPGTVKVGASDTDPYGNGKVYYLEAGHQVNIMEDWDIALNLKGMEWVEVDNPPVADFTYSPKNPDSGESVRFDGSSSTDDIGIASYRWDFGDSSGISGWSSSSKKSHTYSSEGTYGVILEVKDTNGQTDTKEKSVVVGGGTINYEILVTVTDDETTDAIEDANVEVTGDDGYHATDSTDVSGIVTFTNCPPDSYDIVVSATGYNDFTSSRIITAADIEVDASLITGSSDDNTITFVISDLNSQPIKGANVRVWNDDHDYNGDTNTSGKVILYIATGTYDIIVSHDNYDKSADSDVTIDSNKEIEMDMTGGGLIFSLNILALTISIIVIVVAVLLAVLIPLATTIRIVIIIFGIAMAIVLYIIFEILGVTL